MERKYVFNRQQEERRKVERGYKRNKREDIQEREAKTRVGKKELAVGDRE